MRKEMKAKHKMGKNCGYKELPDGSIIIAPTYQNKFDLLLEEEEGIRVFIQHTADHCHKILGGIYKKRKELWKAVAEDYGLDLTTGNWLYNPNRGTVKQTLPDAGETRPH